MFGPKCLVRGCVHRIGFLTAQFAHLCPDVLGNESLANRERRLRHACFAISLYGRALSLIHSSHREHQDSQDDGGQPQIPTNFPVNATRLLDVDRCSPTSTKLSVQNPYVDQNTYVDNSCQTFTTRITND